VRRTDRRDWVRRFQYDNPGRNTHQIWYSRTADANADTNRKNELDFTYNLAGQLLTANDAGAASYTFAYDDLGRMSWSSDLLREVGSTRGGVRPEL